MKCLIIDDEEDIRDIISFLIQHDLPEMEILLAANGQEALDVIKSQSPIDLLITDYNMPKMNGMVLLKTVVDQKLTDAPLVLCSAYVSEEIYILNKTDLFGVVTKPDISEGLKTIIDKYKVVYASKLNSNKTSVSYEFSDYIGISPQSLIKISALPCDIYLKLGPQKFVKNFNNGDVFIQQDLDKLKSKSINRLFVHRKDSKIFIEDFQRTLNWLADKRNLSVDEVRDYGDLILSSLKLFDFSPAVQEHSRKWAVQSVNTIKKISQLSSYLDKLMAHGGSYYSDHTSLLALFSTELAFAMDWRTDSTLAKLSLASLLHDVTLDESLSDPEIHSGKWKELPPDKQKELKEHPVVVSELVKKFREMPPDVDRLVLEHHEDAGGTGFPKGLDASHVGPLSSVFILAHKLTDIVWSKRHTGEKITRDLLIRMLPKEMRVGNFKKIIESYEKVKD